MDFRKAICYLDEEDLFPPAIWKLCYLLKTGKVALTTKNSCYLVKNTGRWFYCKKQKNNINNYLMALEINQKPLTEIRPLK